jgi:hypothetical protein
LTAKGTEQARLSHKKEAFLSHPASEMGARKEEIFEREKSQAGTIPPATRNPTFLPREIHQKNLQEKSTGNGGSHTIFGQE